jgi:putative transposase
VGLSRAAWYYEPLPESPLNLTLMQLLDEQYTKTPFYGVLRMKEWLRREGHDVNEKRVRRLLRKMGLMAIYPKPNLSKPAPGHKTYPYLLKGVTVERPNQVWATDITYVRMQAGFLYLVAILDWYSRYVLSWELSNTMDTEFCLSALERALRHHGKPEIFNSDQGSQFTSQAFTSRLEGEGVRISMDGRGRAFDNILVERLWRTVKYEEIYPKGYAAGEETLRGLAGYFPFYNTDRPHQSLGMATPHEVFTGVRP